MANSVANTILPFRLLGERFNLRGILERRYYLTKYLVGLYPGISHDVCLYVHFSTNPYGYEFNNNTVALTRTVSSTVSPHPIPIFHKIMLNPHFSLENQRFYFKFNPSPGLKALARSRQASFEAGRCLCH